MTFVSFSALYVDGHVYAIFKVELHGRHVFCLSWLMSRSLLVPTTIGLIFSIGMHAYISVLLCNLQVSLLSFYF